MQKKIRKCDEGVSAAASDVLMERTNKDSWATSKQEVNLYAAKVRMMSAVSLQVKHDYCCTG